VITGMKKTSSSFLFNSEITRKKVIEFIKSGEISEIYKAIDLIPLSNREKTVLKALLSRELVTGQVGNTASNILDEITKIGIKNDRGLNVGVKVWNILNQLLEKGFIQVLEGYPKIYFFNRELNPIPNMSYPYSLLTALYEVLPELDNYKNEVVYKADLNKLKKPTSGVFSTNEEYRRLLIQMIRLTANEIIGTTQVTQTHDEFPDIIYTFEYAIAQGIKVYYLFSTKTPQHRIRGYEELGAEVKVVDNEILLRNSIQNIDVFDSEHLMEVNRYEYGEGKKVRFGFWCKYNKMICANYVNTFWKLWRNASKETP
jgi:sugar-specific transcriptional regulator TrmB